MTENKLFEALLDVIPFAAYAVDIETFEVLYANKLMKENMYASQEEHCWKKIFGQEEICSWCTIQDLKQRDPAYKSDKIMSTFFDESTDKWLQSYDNLMKWPDGRSVKYSIAVDISEQKEIQANMIKVHTKLAIQSKKLQEANKKLEFMATKDFLTGINNRGNFFKLTSNIWNQKNENVLVAMLDLDKFKNINDTFGHNGGDEVLKAFAKILLENLDKDDIFGRLGGEEFAIVFVNKDKKTVLEQLENIREKTSKITIKQGDKEIKFTVSIGFSKKQDNLTIDQVLEEADKELYEAKSTGRNKIRFRV